MRALAVAAAAYRGRTPACSFERIAGVDALLALPSAGRGSVVVYANAATPKGVEEPAVARLLGSLACAGFVAVAPELPHVREGEVTPRTVEALVSVAGTAGGRVAFLGASTGAGLAILAAADPRLAPRVSAVAAIAPFASLRTILRLATTGWYGERPYEVAPLVAQAAARSLRASAPDDPAVEPLLANVDPDRFDALYAALAPRTRDLVRLLSPASHIGDVLAPVEIASSPDDAFFPVDESRALTRAGRDVRLTVTTALDHVCPRPGPGVLSLLLLLERTLARAAAPSANRGAPRPRIASRPRQTRYQVPGTPGFLARQQLVASSE